MVPIPDKTNHVKIGDSKLLYRIIDEWYEDLKASGRKPGSELWTTMAVDYLIDEIVTRWSNQTDYPPYMFPWKSEFVALLAIKKRKEPSTKLEG